MSVTRKLWHFCFAIVVASFLCGFLLALPPFYPNAFHYPGVAAGVLLTSWFFSLPVVAFGGLLAGMPVAHLLNARAVGGHWKWAATGGIIGALYSTVVFLVITGGFPPSSYEAVSMPWLGLLPGIAAGLYWWRFVARREQREIA